MKNQWRASRSSVAVCLLFQALVLLFFAGCGENAFTFTEDAVETGLKGRGEKILPVENIQQRPEMPSGCEITSAAIVLNYLGCEVGKTELAGAFPIGGKPHRSHGVMVGPDPWKVFAGSPYGSGYGCFAPVVTAGVNRYLSQKGFEKRAVNLSGTKAETLLSQIDAGNPVIVWATISMKEPYAGDAWFLEGTGAYYRWPAQEHCLVLIGYSGSDAVFSDPLDRQGTVRYDFMLFEKRYRQLLCQAVVIQ